MDKEVARKFLGQYDDVLVFAHTRNIMECLDLFDNVFYLYVPPDELERRFLIDRPDHIKDYATPEQMQFARERHEERYQQAKEFDIPILDSTETPEEVYKKIASVVENFTKKY
jgi:hypothetical protein